MARQKGSNALAATLEIRAGAALDARSVVPTKADLTLSANYPYSYVGMLVSVQDEGKLYILKAKPTTTASNWVEVGSGSGADNIVEGYYNVADGKFYEESTYTTEITGADLVIYISLDTNKTYRFDGTDFVRLDNEVLQYDTLPSPTADLVGEVYQYVGATSGGLTNGYFYTCIEDPSTPGTYIWVQKNVQPDADTQIQVETMPAVTSADLGKIVEYIGATDANYTNGYFYIVVEDTSTTPSTYKWTQKNVQPDQDTKIQVTVMPAVTSADNGKVVQYIGATDANYTHGYFYECKESTVTAGTYEWVQLDIQPDEDTKIQVATMPAVTASDLGKIVQYIGATTTVAPIYTNGYFYEVTEDTSTTPSTYVWTQKNIQPDNDTSIQVASMPAVTVADLGRIVQYIGATDTNYTNGYFYKCVEDTSTTPSTYKWEAVNVQAGGSGGGSLGKAITAAIDVGGIDAGDSFAVGTAYDDMWDALLNPTLYPTYVAPSASLAYTADTYYEVGSTIAAKTGTVTYNAGEINLNGTKQNDRGGAATNYALASSGADTDYSGTSTTSGAFNVSALTKSSKGAITLTATVNYAQGPQPKDSKGNDYQTPLAAGSVTATKTMTFILPYYYGKSASATVSDFTGLTKSVTAKGQKQFQFTTNNEHMVFAYDSSYGNLTSILDPNSFETISGWTKSTLTVGGFSYYVYVANAATTDTNAKFTFKY